MVTNDLEKYCERALEIGQTHAKAIHPGTVVTAPWVRWKCQFGCYLYGKGYCCPPHTPTSEETRKVIDSYHSAILFHTEFLAPDQMKHYQKNSDKLIDLEEEMFKDGYYKAFIFLQGACQICLPRKAKNDKNLTWCASMKGEPCRNGSRKRPSMEGCGIDVYQTARNNGFFIETLKKQPEPWNFYALMLVD